MHNFGFVKMLTLSRRKNIVDHHKAASVNIIFDQDRLGRETGEQR